MKGRKAMAGEEKNMEIGREKSKNKMMNVKIKLHEWYGN